MASEKESKGSPPCFDFAAAGISARGRDGGLSAFAFPPRAFPLECFWFVYARRQELGSEMRYTNDAQPREAR